MMAPTGILPSSPDMSAVALAKEEGLSSEAVVKKMESREENALAGIVPVGHYKIHIKSELDNPICAAGKSENPLNPEPHRLGCQSSTFAEKEMNEPLTSTKKKDAFGFTSDTGC